MIKKELYRGPDISYHNGNVDIKRIRDAGYKRIGIRAGYGKNNVDQKYVQNALACYNLGVDPLIYWFSYALTVEGARNEAKYAIAQAKKYWKTCPIAFDLEYDTVNYARKNGVLITKELATSMAIAFLKKVKSEGFIPVLYTNRDYIKNYFDTRKIANEVGEFYIWYARYISTLPASEVDYADIWQYSSSERIDGVSGNVDMNVFYTDFLGTSVKADREEKCNLNIKNFQIAANKDGYKDANGKPLVEDGFDGPKTQYVRKKINLQAKRKLLGYTTGSTGHVVRWWQTRCNEILGIDDDVDGYFGPKSRENTIAVQKKLSLKVDGIAGYNSIQAAFYK